VEGKTWNHEDRVDRSRTRRAGSCGMRRFGKEEYSGGNWGERKKTRETSAKAERKGSSPRGETRPLNLKNIHCEKKRKRAVLGLFCFLSRKSPKRKIGEKKIKDRAEEKRDSSLSGEKNYSKRSVDSLKKVQGGGPQEGGVIFTFYPGIEVLWERKMSWGSIKKFGNPKRISLWSSGRKDPQARLEVGLPGGRALGRIGGRESGSAHS